jgi:hypothetical protein
MLKPTISNKHYENIDLEYNMYHCCISKYVNQGRILGRVPFPEKRNTNASDRIEMWS